MTFAAIAKFAGPKGVVMAVLVLGVVRSELGPFTQALIIAVVSATITAAGMIYAARIGRRDLQQLERASTQNTQHLEDVKAKLGIDHRRGDPPAS